MAVSYTTNADVTGSAEEARATIEAVEAAPSEEPEGQTSPEENLSIARLVVGRQPSVAVDYAWQAAEELVISLLPAEERVQMVTARQLVQAVKAHRMLNPGAVVVLERLAHLRDIATNKPPTTDQAEGYIQLVEEFLTLIGERRKDSRSMPVANASESRQSAG
ncbi:hypothetical protein [Micromonospora sp. WMMD1274]|uniref:hypothetical protein n=1 Tax=Micromonospora sp. WMMD1274 TaxID=3404116 RepID=UPI003B92327C